MVKKSLALATLISGLCVLPSFADVPTAAQDTAAAQAQYTAATQAAAQVATPAGSTMTPAQVAATMTTLQTQLATGQVLTAPAGVTMTMQSNFVPLTAAQAAANLVNGTATVNSTIGQTDPNAANSGNNTSTTTMNAVLGGTPPGYTAPDATPQYDPSSFLPFQTTTQQTTVQTNEGPITVNGNTITGIYANPAAPPATSVVNGLPQTSLDSFVYEAGGAAELIYGDEGVDSIPPYFEFDQTHRINAGIFGVRAQGLTTGHSAMLPNAWGGDEFVKTEPWTMSGSGVDIGANGQLVNAATGQPASAIGINATIGGLTVNANPVTGLTVGGATVGGTPVGVNVNANGVTVGGQNIGTGF